MAITPGSFSRRQPGLRVRCYSVQLSMEGTSIHTSLDYSPRAQLNARYVSFLACTAAMGGLLFGFDIAIITGAGPFLARRFALSDISLGIAFSSLLFGCVLGSIFAGRLTDQYGRRRMLLWVALIFAASSIATAGMNTLLSGRSEAEDSRTGKFSFCISLKIAAATRRLTGKAGVCAVFQAWKAPLLCPSTGSRAV